MIKYFSEFCINLYKWLRPSNSKGLAHCAMVGAFSVIVKLQTLRKFVPSSTWRPGPASAQLQLDHCVRGSWQNHPCSSWWQMAATACWWLQ